MKSKALMFGLLTAVVGMASGCVGPPEYNTQYFRAGEATCLSGKLLYFGYYPPPSMKATSFDQDSIAKATTFNHYPRGVDDFNGLLEDHATHETIDFSHGDPFELKLSSGQEFSYYDERFDAIHIGSDGTLGFGMPGTGGESLLDAFSSPQILLLPVDATVEGASVRYAAGEDKIVITYENVSGCTFQCVLYIQGEGQYELPEGEGDYEMAIVYAVVNENTRDGVVGLPDRTHSNLVASESVQQFLDTEFIESNLCHQALANEPGASGWATDDF